VFRIANEGRSIETQYFCKMHNRQNLETDLKKRVSKYRYPYIDRYFSMQLASEDSDCDEHVVISRRGSVIISSTLEGRSQQLLLPVKEEARTMRRDVMLFHEESADDNDGRATRKRPSISLANYGSNVLMFDNTIVDNSPRKAIGDHILKALYKVRIKVERRT